MYSFLIFALIFVSSYKSSADSWTIKKSDRPIQVDSTADLQRDEELRLLVGEVKNSFTSENNKNSKFDDKFNCKSLKNYKLKEKEPKDICFEEWGVNEKTFTDLISKIFEEGGCFSFEKVRYFRMPFSTFCWEAMAKSANSKLVESFKKRSFNKTIKIYESVGGKLKKEIPPLTLVDKQSKVLNNNNSEDSTRGWSKVKFASGDSGYARNTDLKSTEYPFVLIFGNYGSKWRLLSIGSPHML